MSTHPFSRELEWAQRSLRTQRVLGRLVSLLTLGLCRNRTGIQRAMTCYDKVCADVTRLDCLTTQVAELDQLYLQTIELQGVRVSQNAFPDVSPTFRQKYPINWDAIRDMILTRDGFACTRADVHCSGPLQIHHVRPLSKGGANSPSNLLTLCYYHHSLNHPHMKGR